MSAQEFNRRMNELQRAVGRGKMRGRIVCDQVYARYQHETLNLRHPHGGGPKFLIKPLHTNLREYMGTLAEKAITPEGSDLQGGMTSVVEAWSKDAAKGAPIEWGDLRNSMHPTVTVGGREVYNRQPMARRLTREELRLKARWRL